MSNYDYAHLDDYEQYSDEDGLEQCPWCGVTYHMEGGERGPVVDTAGRTYDYYIETDPGTRFYCPSCWKEHKAARNAEENQSLGEWL